MSGGARGERRETGGAHAGCARRETGSLGADGERRETGCARAGSETRETGSSGTGSETRETGGARADGAGRQSGRSRGGRSLGALLGIGFAACSAPQPAPTGPAPLPPIAAIDAGPPPPVVAASNPLDTKESREVARTLKRVSELRGVTATKPVPGVTLPRDELVAKIKDKAMREFPADAIKREGDVLKLFGFAPASFDYLAAELRLLESQLEGFYEPNNGTMYLAADLKGTEAKVTLAHELDHALQDQRWDLKPHSGYRPGESDKTMAHACLAEGDATSLMIDYDRVKHGGTALDLDDDLLRGSMAAGMELPALKDIPAVLKAGLIAPYVNGIVFVNAARRKGGWELVNKIWDRPPISTEQVLHLAKWEAHEAPIPVSTPTATALGAGWQREDEDTYGELDLAITLAQWIPEPDAYRAAEDWGGDKSAVWAKGDEIAFVLHERYDPGAPKAHVYAKVLAGMKKTLGKPKIDTADTYCVERAGLGPLILTRKGRDVVLAAGPATRGATWSSNGTCAQTKKWADEVLANP